MRGEAVDWNVHHLALLELLQCFVDQIKVERVRMVKVVLVSIGSIVLLGREYLVEGIHAEQRHPLYVKLFDDLLGHCGLAGRTATTQALKLL